MNRIAIILILINCFVIQAFPQKIKFTRADTLRGSITDERKWWDLTCYHLDIYVNPADSTIKGKNIVTYKVLESDNVMQIDLQPPLRLYKALQNGKVLKIEQEGNAHFITLEKEQFPGTLHKIELQYGGRPRIARRPPWDGGITWTTDRNGKPFIASSCQGIGASIWWPCKDHMYNDRPIIGYYNVNHSGSGDMYSKGGNMLHTLRQIIDDDTKWRSILRGLNREFYHQTVTSKQIENYISDKTGRDLSSFFDQYLRDTRIPVFEYSIKETELSFRWNNCIRNFDMPLKVFISGKEKWLSPTSGWSTIKIKQNDPALTVDPDFYVAALKNF